MRKILVAVFCLFLFGACSQKSEVDQTEIPEKSLELAVRSGEGVIPIDIPASVYELTGIQSEEGYEPTFFTQGEEIAFKELLSGEHTFFVLGNHIEDQYCAIFSDGKDKKTLELIWENRVLPELFGGIIKVKGSNAKETVEMARLVGGVEVNVLNKEEFTSLIIRSYNELQDTIRLNDYMLIPRSSSPEWNEGELTYNFPTSSPIKGEIIAYDNENREYHFDFESTKHVERNKKLTLNITLKCASYVARSATAGNTVTCIEEVSEL